MGGITAHVMNTLDPKPDRLQSIGNSWEERLEYIVRMMRDVSRQTDPRVMMDIYRGYVSTIFPTHRYVSLSRRDLPRPFYRVTRSDIWTHHPDPWRQKDALPMFDRGLLGDLLWGDWPVIIDDLSQVLKPDDPGLAYFAGMSSLIAIPHYDNGDGLNMVVMMRKEANGFDRNLLPEQTWTGNLFGRATKNLVLSRQLDEAYRVVDKELQVVADIQRSLLPSAMPDIQGMEVATYYQTSKRAGGDYYDFFPFADNRWGFFVADVSGHGTPAAVIMAVTHAIAHTCPDDSYPPGKLLQFVNQHLSKRYTNGTGTFVTAFYGVYDPATRTLEYSCAGHPPPMLIRCSEGKVDQLSDAQCLPLGIDADEVYVEASVQLQKGDIMVIYTDGITEARAPAGEMFGSDRLKQLLTSCAFRADALIRSTLQEVDAFTVGAPPNDDRTLVIAKVKL